MRANLGVPRPDQADYMLKAAASAAGRHYKRELLDLLEVEPGQVTLDVGCGPGADLPLLAERVGEGGTVIGVDRDPAMLAEARRRTSALPVVEVREGDAHALPLEPGTVDRAKIDRVLMHVTDPDEVLAGLHLVTRTGGRIALAEPDWDTLIVDAEDLDASRAFTRYTTSEAVRNATVGRTLARRAERAGFTVEAVTAATPVFLDFAEADRVLGLGRNTRLAIEEGHMNADRARRWFASLAEGPFYASFTLITVACSR
ncbi:methyltransferase domain-containing protein [Streptomyces fradiae]|uniref:methyltransferase domain-containing protein n=1 Tax=Streptomyces fradiae TaxID=1906 RepID=UPI0035BE4652